MICRILLALVFSILSFSCVKTKEEVLPATPNTTSPTPTGTTNNGLEDKSFHELASDYEYDKAGALQINLNQTTATSTASGVKITGQTITISTAANYILKGSLTDGQIIIDTKDDKVVRLALNGVNIKKETSAAIYIKNAKKVIIDIVEGTENTLSDAGKTYIYDDAVALEPNAVIFSKEDLSIMGNGKLTINAGFKDGIASKDGLVIKSGNTEVTAADDAIRGKDYVVMQGGNLILKAGADGIKATETTDATLGYLTINGGDVQITAGDDGMHGENAITINNGNINIKTSREGIESKKITINDGHVELISTDDGINVGDGTDSKSGNRDLSFTMNGGYLLVNSNGDGLDSNGSIFMNGGKVIVYGPTAGGNSALDFDGSFTLNGGLLISFVGTAQMAQQPGNTSKQNNVMVQFPAAYNATNIVHVEDADAKELITISPLKRYQVMVFSSPNLKNGSYKLFLGGSSDKTAPDGFLTGSKYSIGTLNTTFTLSNIATKISGK